jgi:poly-gamma-glutamate synthesis protein (capsule biosynthesis protein)
MEWYKSSAIFYGLGHFVFDLEHFRGPKEIVTDGDLLDPETDDSYDLAARVGWPLLPWHRDARMTALAWVKVADGKVTSAGFLPCMLNRQGQVYPVDATSDEGRKVTEYVAAGSTSQKLNAAFRSDPDTRFGGYGAVAMTRI